MERLLRLASRMEGVETPFLALDREIIREQASVFSRYGDRCRSFYAVKANPDPGVLAVIAESGLGFEISSKPELDLLIGLGVAPERIITSNPVKSPAFIEAMYGLGTRRFVFDSPAEAEKLARLAPGSEVIARLTVENDESLWPLADKYGLGPEAAADLLVGACALGLAPWGVTFHVGSQCQGLASWRKATERAATVWERAQERGVRLRHLNIGGGFPAHHTDDVPSVAEVFDHVLPLASELLPAGVELSAEPGRAVVADAGVLVCSVIGKASREDGGWLYLDAGVFNGLMEAVGNIGYRFIPTAPGGATGSWTIAGPSCDSFDVVAKGVPIAEPQVGDRVLVYPAGAYTTAYASTFNGAVIPPVLLG